MYQTKLYTHLCMPIAINANIPIELMKYVLISDFIVHTYDNEILAFETLK